MVSNPNISPSNDGKTRCRWVSDDPLYQAYHDLEWGVPQYDEAALFEMLCLEGQQAGLSWITVLKKRACYRQHFFQYSIADIAQMSDEILKEKQQDTGLIRHYAKLKAIRDNAIAWQKMQQQGIDMVAWLWQFAPTATRSAEGQTQSPESERMAKQLKKQGFKFMGATTCYAFMQAVGMVKDHEPACFCYSH